MRNQLEQLLYSSFLAPRQTYTHSDLGSPIISLLGKRIDFSLNSIEGNYKCSYYKPKIASSNCVIYLHSMGGSRLESCGHAQKFLQKGIGFSSLDFCGSGLSQGQNNSLGHHSQQEVLGLMEALNSKFGVQKFILWGRSMGAAIAIKVMECLSNQGDENNIYSRKFPYKVTAIILDSPFSSLNKIISQIAQQKMTLIPKIFIKATIGLMRNTIQNITKCSLEDYQLLPRLRILNVPVIIIASKQDSITNFEHAELIYKNYPSRNKQLIFVSGEHAEPRNQATQTTLINFATKHFKQNAYHSLSKHKKQSQSINMKNSSLFIKNNITKNKQHSSKKIQTQISILQNTFHQFQSDSKKHIVLGSKKLTKCAYTQRNSMYVQKVVSPPSTRRINQRPNALISQESIPAKKKPIIVNKRKQHKRMTSSFPISMTHYIEKSKKQHSNIGIEYEVAQVNQCGKFLC